ncbi:ABC transporter permease [Lutispora saccharofermentans]|uniref:Transport permease protein n=1 Tax=Lutispora saccharofermentans TaxID=3024236 RepID=A0ABT1NG80_9FIRM|nr:ABC transporter permease [Lutispora saccharofermentans]MCQ1529158.1 ABC transporter permease [Lutispora saccharofermentans]
MLEPFKLIWEYRKIIKSITINDIKAKYAGSFLGILWAFIYPILFLSVYFIVYVVIFKIRLNTMSTFDYVLLIFCGLIPWFGFSEAIGTGVNSVTSNSSLLKNTLFPVELIPVKVVFASMISQLIGMGLLMLVLIVKGYMGLAVLALPILLILQIVFSTGLVWILASLNVFFRDIGQIITVVLIMLMMVSPIAYTNEMISPQILPYMKANPLYYLITMLRDILMFNRLPGIYDFSIFLSVSVFVFYLGYFVFSRLKVVFADYV